MWRRVVCWDVTDVSEELICLPPAYLLVLAEIFFDPEDGDNFLRNVGRNSTDYTASYPRRWYSSKPPLWKPQILYTIRMIKLKRMRWAGHVTRMGKKRTAYRILIVKPEGKRPLGRPKRRWEDNIKMDLREMGWGGMEWIYLAQDRPLYWTFGFHKMLGNSWAAKWLAASQGLSSMELFISYNNPQL
jgi:hypothetical protein